MRHIKLFGLCLTAALATCAIATAVASAASPSFEFSGKSDTFSSKGGALKLETTAGEEIKCETTTATGEVEGSSGSHTVRDVLQIFKGCTTKILTITYECQSAGAAKKEIKGFGLRGKLGYLTKAENKVGILLSPEEGKEGNPNNLVAEFECTHASEKVKVKVKGSIIGLVTPVEKSVAPGEHFLVDFSKGSGKGESLDKKFEGEAENILETENTVSKKFSASALEGSLELFPSVSTKIAASVAPPETDCPITSEGVTFDASVTSGNEGTLRNEVVNSTWGPEGGNESCKEVSEFNADVTGGKITTAQKEEYKKSVEEAVVPGVQIYVFKWHRTGGSSFTTLGIANSAGELEFEPIGTWEAGSPTIAEEPVKESAGVLEMTRDLSVRDPVFRFVTLSSGTVTQRFHTTDLIHLNTPETVLNVTNWVWDTRLALTLVEEKTVTEGGVECLRSKVKERTTLFFGAWEDNLEKTYRLCANGEHSVI